jgi:tRNA modification GTPase
MKKNDPIAAIATAAGEGAIAVVRLSGNNALIIGDQIFSKKVSTLSSHTLHYGKILDRHGKPIDQVVLAVMRGPRSYTGEDTLEISCHGGHLISRKVLERVFEAGARAANPGEFSLRAFLNGKIDLAQAEAVQTLISSKNELAMRQAEKQLSGVLSSKISSFQKNLTEVAAILEASVDFPEEDLQFSEKKELLQMLQKVLLEMETLQSTFSEGQVLQEGIFLCLAGSPNVGKSSLMNALLGFDRAIVTEIAGTTRDRIDEDLNLGSLHFRLTDTAGIRETEEVIEKEGIRRSKKAMDEADLILIVLDASRPLSLEEEALIAKIPEEKRLLVLNKIDLKPLDLHGAIGVSAKERMGLDLLKQAIEKKIWAKGAPSKEEVLITSLRHHQALSLAIDLTQTAICGIEENRFPELVAIDVRGALLELGTIIGTNVTEDILSMIFSKFCLGK